MKAKSISLITLILAASCTTKQEPVTLADYQRAEKFLSVYTTPLVSGLVTNKTWLNNDLFFYKNSTDNGWEFLLANPSTKEKKRAFDHYKLAAALTALDIKDIKAHELGIAQADFSDDGLSMTFNIGSQRLQVGLTDYEIEKLSPRKKPNEQLSPNGKLAAYIKNFNLWIRNLETDKSTQLTFDGNEDFGYATNNAGWTKSDLPVLLWSPNSDKIATFQHDGRGVGEMYLYNTQVGHSKLEQ
jgi:Dipeptidyl peptidase IV (DPP IV) N-terminal region